MLADLAKAGIPIAREKQMGADGNLQAWIEDPDGNRIELMQMDPRTTCRLRRCRSCVPTSPGLRCVLASAELPLLGADDVCLAKHG